MFEKKTKTTPTCHKKISSWLTDFTGYELENVNSFDKLTRFLHSPRDGSSLAVARIFYGEKGSLLIKVILIKMV